MSSNERPLAEGRAVCEIRRMNDSDKIVKRSLANKTGAIVFISATIF